MNKVPQLGDFECNGRIIFELEKFVTHEEWSSICPKNEKIKTTTVAAGIP